MVIPLQNILDAQSILREVLSPTPLQYNERLSHLYEANVYLKREDLTVVRSFKIRGAYTKMASLTKDSHVQGVVCASAGNHAQGVAFSCAKLHIHGVIFMPSITPNQKISKVKYFGGKFVTIELVGHTFDETFQAAKSNCEKANAVFIHPFDDEQVIAGQGTVGKELTEQLQVVNHISEPDYVLCPIGGGGLISGVASYLKYSSPNTKVIGVEPEHADSMNQAVKHGKPVTLDKFDTFVDGAAVRTTGAKTLSVVKDNVTHITVVATGAVCTTMIDLYQNEGIVAEPAGALSVTALEHHAESIRGKTVVCIISGGNNDLLRYPEIMEKSLVYKGLKHYFIIEFAQKPGQLKNFLNHALGPHDDIVLFEYLKRTNKEKGAALVGIELSKKEDITPLLEKMDKIGLTHKKITSNDLVFNLLI